MVSQLLSIEKSLDPEKPNYDDDEERAFDGMKDYFATAEAKLKAIAAKGKLSRDGMKKKKKT